jgi:hypothetical protein
MQLLARVVFVGTVHQTKHWRPRPQHSAEAKIDAYGIGREETRHPRWERCRALWSALERPVCFQRFSRIRRSRALRPSKG